MQKSGLLRQADVRAALRLVGECRDLKYDPGLTPQERVHLIFLRRACSRWNLRQFFCVSLRP
jgi:hypothetical protein